MNKAVIGLIEEARKLPLPEQLSLIEHLARSIHGDLLGDRALQNELAAWDDLSDEALVNFERSL